MAEQIVHDSRVHNRKKSVARGRFRLKDNVRAIVRDAQGNVVQQWQPNADGVAFHKKHGFWSYKPEHGALADELNLSNLVVNTGLAAVAKRIGGLTMNAFTYIAIGEDGTAAAAGQTALLDEITTDGGERVNVTPTSITTTVTDDTIELENTFTFTASFALEELGILNAASSGTLLSRYVYPVINVTSGMEVTFVYRLDVS